jgi:HEAT repeat protein
VNSRLSSLLVRDGVLGVKRMEQAFQRQVIYGGALDTILLEMGAVPEERLWHYLSLSTGLPAADRDLLEYFDPRAVQVCPRDNAERFHVAPCALDGPALRVLVTDPVDLGELESLATSLGVPVQPFVVPEYRFHLHLERLFGIPTPSRFAALARKGGFVPSVRPSEPSIVVDDSAVGEAALPRDTTPMAAVPEPVTGDQNITPRHGPAARRTVVFSTEALQKELAAEVERRRAAASAAGLPPETAAQNTPGVQLQPSSAAPAGPSAAPATPVAAPVTAPNGPAAPAAPVEGLSPLPLTRGTIKTAAATPQREPTYEHDKVIADPALVGAAPPGGDGAVRAPWRGGTTLEPRPIEPREARQLLAHAEDRDAIFGLLVRAARARARFAALLTVQGATAFGRVAIDGDELDHDVGQVAIPLASAPALRGAYESRSPYIGPVRSGLPEIDHMLERLGGVIPPAALILPVVIRERTVALVIAHRGGDTVSIAEVADVLPVATDAAVALSRLIVKAKSTGFRRADQPETGAGGVPAPAAAPAAPPGDLSDLPGKAKAPADRAGGGWGLPSAEASAAVPATLGPNALTQQMGAAATVPGLAPPRPIAEVVDAVESGAEPAATRAADEALARLDDLLSELGNRFPGRLTVDRYGMSGRALRASQHGNLLALVVRVGPRVVPLMVEKLASADREVRYYATLVLAEVRAPIAVAGLVARVFDSDYGVRGAAIEALLGYPPRDVDAALEPVRRALRSDSLRARAAAHALGELRDVKAILDLIDATERDPTTAAEAHRALVLITKQDFGTKAKKWRKWWEEHKDRSRIEWMLEALAHGDEHVRQSASEELKRLTGEYFGYHHDAPKREREEARQRWLKWWDETGRKRFSGAGAAARS